MSAAPKISHILELCLYARSLPTSIDFYTRLLSVSPHFSTPRVAAFSLGPTTLLLFQRGQTLPDSTYAPGQIIPGHGLSDSDTDDKVHLKTHFALAVEKKEELDKWEERLKEMGVGVTGRVDWPRGGRSIYFEDVDGNVGEIASKGIWPNY